MSNMTKEEKEAFIKEKEAKIAELKAKEKE